MIEVRLFATLREGRDKILFIEPDQHKNAKSILASLDIATKDVAILLINGRHSKPIDVVHDGDVIALFPPIGGG